MMSTQDTHNHANDIRDALVAMNNGDFSETSGTGNLVPLNPRSGANVEI